MQQVRWIAGAVTLCLLTLIMAAQVRAETHTPSNTRVGVEFRLSSAEMELFVNGVPVFSPNEGLSTQSSINSGLDVNTSIQKGANTITVRLRTVANDDGFDQAMRLRVLHWPTGFLPNFFAPDVPFLADVQLTTTELGMLTVTSNTSQQTDAHPRPVVVSPPQVAPGEWITITIAFDLDMPFPQPVWPSVAQDLTGALELSELTPLYRQIHDSAAQGQAGLLRAIKPSMDRAGAGYGWSGEQFFNHAFGVLFDPDLAFSLQQLDTTGRNIRLFGGGRLATIIPSPITYVSEVTGETAELWLYFWKDQNAEWQLMQ
ncbi:MAG: hypothetical protein ACRBBK_12550 [Paracoccaceae bacterium]